MKLTINVTQEDIKNGKRRSATKCPVSLALTRQLSLETSIYFEGYFLPTITESIKFNNKQLADWIYNYDNDISVQPISFEIEKYDLSNTIHKTSF